MSYIQSTIKCQKCGREMNVAFGIVGSMVIADGGPSRCPDCGGKVSKISDGWNAKD